MASAAPPLLPTMTPVVQPAPAPASLAWPLCLLAILAIFHIDVALHRAINWDEFHHFTQITAFNAGELRQPLQTLLARLTAWADALPGDALEKLQALRLTMLACLMVAAASIYACAGRFAERRIALLCAALYLSAGFVLQHGASYRADAPAAALLMASLAIVLRTRLARPQLFLSAFLLAVAGLITIKSVLYAPVFAGAFYLHLREQADWRAAAVRSTAFGFATLACFTLLYFAHSATLGEQANTVAKGVVSSSSRKMFALGGLPYYEYIPKAAFTAIPFALCIVAAPVMVWREKRLSGRQIALAGCWLPITVLGFYHNTAPYFYVFILAPVAVACAPVLAVIVQRVSIRFLVAFIAIGGTMTWAAEDRGIMAKQASLITASEEMLGEPVNYFDAAGFLPGHRKANHFMTPWANEGYRGGYYASHVAIMEREPVPLVLAADKDFELLFAGEPSPEFLPEDASALRENFIQLWGIFWIAGREIAAGEERRTDVLVPGTYRIEGSSLRIDGQSVPAGSTTTLARGPHSITNLSDRDARLVWGEHTRAPVEPPPIGPYWAEF